MNKLRLEYTHFNTVARVILDFEKGNILDRIMMDELIEVFGTFRENTDLKLITLEGAGKHFSFGASVEEHRKDQAAAMLKGFHRLFYTLRDLSIPLAVKISGQCLGGGLEIALMCNFMFADTTAKMGQPEIILGVFPPPASVILPMKIGSARAEEILLTGRVFTAREGKEMGLILEVFEDQIQMEEGVNVWIEQYILPKSASSLRYAVKAARKGFNQKLSVYLPELEEMYTQQLMNTQDANEGIESFLEKRSPVWKNN